MTYTVHFIRGNGTYAFCNSFEADSEEQAKAKAALALDGFQQFNNEPDGIANLVRCDTGALIGSMNKGFQFVAA